MEKEMQHRQKQKRWKLIINIVTLLAFAALVYVVRDQIAETIRQLGRVNMIALLLILPAQALSFYSGSRMYQDLLLIFKHKVPFWPMNRVNIELNFVNNVFPSGGITGFSYFGIRMRDFDVPAGTSTLIQMMRFILTFVSFQVLLFVGLFVLALGGQANNLVILIAGSLSTLLFVGTVVLVYIIGSKQRINTFFTFLTQWFNKLVHLFRRNNPEAIDVARVQRLFGQLHENYLVLKKDPKILKKPLLYALLTNFAEVLTIYVVYIAFGSWVNPGAVIIAYAIANFAGLVSILPGGVGIYEGLMTAVLASAGVPAGVSIPVTVMYRVLNMALKLPPGYILYHQAIRKDRSLA